MLVPVPVSEKAVYAAIAGSAAVAVSKSVAAFFSSSPAMFAEAVHSLADLGNDSLLAYGKKRSRLPPDAQHPLGHGQEAYFWNFVMGILVFAIGAAFAFYEGVRHIIHPGRLESPLWSYIVLGASAFFEGASLRVGYREFRKRASEKPFFAAVRASKDPAVVSVVLEDIAALAGIAVAACGIWLAHWLHRAFIDGITSVIIGVLLTTVSLLIARETKGLLVGEGMDARALEQIRTMVQACSGVHMAYDPITMYFGPEKILLAIDVEFSIELSSAKLAEAIDRIESSVRQEYPDVSRIYIEAQAISSAVGKRERQP